MGNALTFVADALEIGHRIRKRREALGLTQKDLADKVFCTAQAVSRWEVGATLPSIATLGFLAIALKTSSDYILGLVSEAQDTKNRQTQKEGGGGSPSSPDGTPIGVCFDSWRNAA